MRRENGLCRMLSQAVVAAAVAGLTPLAHAADRSADLVAAMRERGWDDTAAEFLAWVEKSPLASEEFGKELPYQQAQVLAAQGRGAGGDQRKRILAEAARSFEKFADSQAASPQVIDALRQAANLYAENALATLNDAKQLPSQAATEREKARRDARESLEAAARAADRVAAVCNKELASLPKPADIQANPEAKARRDKLRNQLAEARFLRALFEFEKSRTFEAKSVKFTESLDRSSKLFGGLSEEYRNTIVGLTSRFYQGRCAQEQGDFDKALSFYKTLIDVPTASPELRTWAARAHRHRVECLLALEELDEALRDSQDWLASSRPIEREQAPWLELAFRLANVYSAQLKEAPPGGADAKKLQTAVRDLLREVAQHPNEFQTEARLAAALGPASTGGQTGAQPKTFSDAFLAGKTALDLMNSSLVAVKLARENNPQEVKSLEGEADSHKAESLRLLELAAELADRQTPVDELNTTRYYLCWLYWQGDRKFEAAVLGEYLARNFPDAEFARGAANFALAALEQLANEARSAAPAAGGFESRKLAELAEFVAGRWPSSPEAAAAVNILIGAALRENRLEEAEELLAKLPAEGRVIGEMNLGAGLWTKYLRTTAGHSEPPDEAALALRDKAGALLQSGFAGVAKAGAPTTASATGALFLAQYLLAKGEAGEAISVLQHETAGPLSLVKSKSESASRPEFIEETYKVALRAYLSSQPPRRDQAKKMMEALEQTVVKADGDSAQVLTRMYISLGLQLQRQLKELTTAGDDATAKQVAAAFGDVLERVASRPNSGDWAIRNWLAQTNLQIGQGLRGAEAKAYLDRAQSGYEAILADAGKDKTFAPSDVALLGVRMRLGDCLLARGQYSEGLDQYAAILREKPNAIDWQQAAAAALQEWGVAKKDAAALDRSIRGAMPQKDGKNLVWGWLRLAEVADRAKRQAVQAGASGAEGNPQLARYEDLYYEARFNVAKARFQSGMIATGAERRKQLAAAKTNVDSMVRLYPDLGGPKWKAAFDGLLAQVNQELAKK